MIKTYFKALFSSSVSDNPYDLTVVSDIPEDATLAETYYSQFEDEFEASDSDVSDNCDNEETLKYTSDDDDEEDDFSALVDQMENALEYSATELDSSLSDEIVGQALSMTMRDQRMTNLRKYPFILTFSADTNQKGKVKTS